MAKLWLCGLLVLVAASHAHAWRTVVVDAGHGGHDRGGIPQNLAPEAPYTLAVARRLKPLLEARGYNVVMTRTSDYYVTLPGRCAVANRQRNAVFVSIHFDSFWSRARGRAANGITVYYTKSNSGRLAYNIHKHMVRNLRPETDRGVKRARFYVIRNTLCPSVLIEGGFLTNPQETQKIRSAAYQQRLAEAIARGIAESD
jgi:N-acetylmuramoyl-L-alanine amidase